MSVQNSQKIYNFAINSPQDLERALTSCNPQEQKRISELFDHYVYPGEENVNPHGLNQLFQNIYQETLGSTASHDFRQMIESYQNFLRDAVTTCNEVVTPQLIQSLQCHQVALRHYLNLEEGNRKPAFAAMAQGVENIQNAADEYKRLIGKLLSVVGPIAKLSNYALQQMSAMSCQRDTIAANSTESIPLKQERIDWLNRNITSLSQTHASLNLLLTHPFHQQLLPDVARHVSNETFSKFLNQQMLEVMECGGGSFVLLEVETQYDEDGIPLANASVKSLEEEFEESFLRKLTLAKVNQMIVRLLNIALHEVEEAQGVISEIEQDPIAIAMRENPS